MLLTEWPGAVSSEQPGRDGAGQVGGDNGGG